MIDFERFYFNTKNIIYQYIYQRLEDCNETEDIAQEVYLLALEGWDELQDHPNPAGWLMQTTKNLISGFRRRIYYRLESLEEGFYKEVPYYDPAFNMLVMEDLLECVYNKKEQIIAKKYFLEDDSVEDLAKELGVSEGSVRTRLYRMRLRLKHYVESYERV